MKAQTKVGDEFAFILLAGIVMILILAFAYSTLQAGPVTAALSTSNLQIAQGNSADVTLHLNGTGFNISLSSTGEISNWAAFDQNNFDLSGTKDITVTFIVPRNADFRTYSGYITILSADRTTKVPVTIDVTLATVSSLPKNIRLGDFTVSYAVGTSNVGEKDDFEISKSYFSDSYYSFVATVPDDKLGILTDGLIQVFVENSNKAGNIIIELNGERVYANTILAGEIDIPLNASAIHKYNSIVLRAGNPGFMFWTNTYYKIKFAKMEVSFNGVSSKQATFTLDSRDVNDFTNGKLSFQVQNYDPNNLGPLTIEINGVTMWDDAPTLTYFSKTFGREIPLYPGDNTIYFWVKQAANYQLANVILTINHHI